MFGNVSKAEWEAMKVKLERVLKKSPVFSQGNCFFESCAYKDLIAFTSDYQSSLYPSLKITTGITCSKKGLLTVEFGFPYDRSGSVYRMLDGNVEKLDRSKFSKVTWVTGDGSTFFRLEMTGTTPQNIESKAETLIGSAFSVIFDLVIPTFS